MDTVLNLGMNESTLAGFAKKTGNERTAWDSFRRFLYMYGNVVLGVDSDKFEHLIGQMKIDKGVSADTDLTIDDLKELADSYRQLIKTDTGNPFPEDPMVQLWGAIHAVFKSWNLPRARRSSCLDKAAYSVRRTSPVCLCRPISPLVSASGEDLLDQCSRLFIAGCRVVGDDAFRWRSRRHKSGIGQLVLRHRF